jgi:hypothetical protein
MILPIALDGIPIVDGLRRRRDPVQRLGDPAHREPGGVQDNPLFQLVAVSRRHP